jgi:hypothetical protein
MTWPLQEDFDDQRLDEPRPTAYPASNSRTPDDAAPLGRIPRNSSGRLRRQPLLRDSIRDWNRSWDVALGHDHNPGEETFVDGAPAPTRMHERRLARIWRTGSTAMCAPSSFSSASPNCSYRTNPRTGIAQALPAGCGLSCSPYRNTLESRKIFDGPSGDPPPYVTNVQSPEP